MPSRRARMVQRDRKTLELKVLHVEVTVASYEFLKTWAGAKQMPMGGALDVILQKKAKETLYKPNDSSC